MKIAVAHYSGTNDIGGVTTWLIGFLDSLVNADHEVILHLHHFGDDTQQAAILPSLRRIGIEPHAVCRTGNLEADTRQTLEFLNRVQPDLFLPQCLHAHFFAAAHAGRQGLPWVFTMHSDDPDYWSIAETLTPEANGGISVCVSQYLARQLRQLVPATSPHVIPYGTILPTVFASYSASPFRVVYSGRLVEQQKCIFQIVETLVQACKRSSQIEAILIGDGLARAACEKIVQDAGLADRISFIGRVPPDQVQPLLRGSQAILLMSAFEGLPVALLEAMAAGVVPVVRSISSGIPELVHHEHTGLLVPNDPSAAADALIRLSHNPHLWQYCSGNARMLVQASYTSKVGYEHWLQLIQHCHTGISKSYPISTMTLHRGLPFANHLFQRQYTSPPSPWDRFHPRRIIRRLRAMQCSAKPNI